MENIVKYSRHEKNLLHLLQRDASLSLQELSEQLNQSKSSVWRNIKKLEDQGVIKKRTTLLDARKLNLPLTVYVSVRTNQHNAQWSENFRKVVEQIPEIIEVHRMSGDLDYFIKALVSDIDGYDRVYQRLIRADLFDVSSSFVMETMKSTTELPLSHL
ncbi:MAG: Lrp/AsnC family transcriptional regulator [Halieaceae bacterium]|nr:Lrp/AsnC family transcriptional regulator [Halieaceae bacterium]